MVKRFLKVTSVIYVISIITLCLVYNYSNIRNNFFEQTELNVDKEVQIWSKAAIGDYLWSHVFNAKLEVINNSLYLNGNITLNGVYFRYFSGPGYIQTTLPQDVEYLVLILNGRTTEHTVKAEQWLDYMRNLIVLKRLAVVLLGNEDCVNDWILKYLKSKGGIIDVLFIVYDSPLVDDNEVFQWPLGVATYRGFPKIDSAQIDTSRKHFCNFMGTVYRNSSRQTLVEIMHRTKFKQKCLIKARGNWIAQESKESLNRYIEVLNKSTLTLSPAGKNPECYRLYEAISLGSVPVIAMEPNRGNCANPPLRLLSSYKAPLIQFATWQEAIDTLLSDDWSPPYTSNELISWYDSFKKKLTWRFVKIIFNKFFLNYLRVIIE